jgi:hypothetical protein
MNREQRANKTFAFAAESTRSPQPSRGCSAVELQVKARDRTVETHQSRPGYRNEASLPSQPFGGWRSKGSRRVRFGGSVRAFFFAIGPFVLPDPAGRVRPTKILRQSSVVAFSTRS